MPDHISYSEFQNEWISSPDVKQFNHITNDVAINRGYRVYYDSGTFIGRIREVA